MCIILLIYVVIQCIVLRYYALLYRVKAMLDFSVYVCSVSMRALVDP